MCTSSATSLIRSLAPESGPYSLTAAKAHLNDGITEDSLPYALTSLISNDNAFDAISEANYKHCPISTPIGKMTMVRQLPSAIAGKLPVQPIELRPAKSYEAELLVESVEAISKFDDMSWLAAKYASFIAFTGSVAGRVAPTNFSFPLLPNVVFLGENASSRIPPGISASSPDALILAENLLHEATHHALGEISIARDVFVSAYNTKTGPRFPIEWRSKDPDPRNRTWSLTRVLHAAMVYHTALHWRQFSESLGPSNATFYQQAAMAAQEKRNYLTECLRRGQASLAADGKAMLEFLEGAMSRN